MNLFTKLTVLDLLRCKYIIVHHKWQLVYRNGPTGQAGHIKIMYGQPMWYIDMTQSVDATCLDISRNIGLKKA